MNFQLWKSKKILKLEISWTGGIRVKPSSGDGNKSIEKAEALTKEIDREGMRYLSYLLYPLCIAGAGYSLFYQPHKRFESKTFYYTAPLRYFYKNTNVFLLTAGIPGH